ncbi:MAG: hypothetical protein HC780_24600 [Leptolyngbyaceae cyanobacterium CSU_1_3]|nr:hypothetical protein [Leptolyngbyaceae cyanobacterium CSU_1_3]
MHYCRAFCPAAPPSLCDRRSNSPDADNSLPVRSAIAQVENCKNPKKSHPQGKA